MPKLPRSSCSPKVQPCFPPIAYEHVCIHDCFVRTYDHCVYTCGTPLLGGEVGCEALFSSIREHCRSTTWKHRKQRQFPMSTQRKPQTSNVQVQKSAQLQTLLATLWQDAAKGTQDRPRTAQDDPKTAPGPLEAAPRAPKTAQA